MDLVYAPSHKQDSTYHGFCYISFFGRLIPNARCKALARTRNSSMGPPWGIDPTTYCTINGHYHRATSRSSHDIDIWKYYCQMINPFYLPYSCSIQNHAQYLHRWTAICNRTRSRPKQFAKYTRNLPQRSIKEIGGFQLHNTTHPQWMFWIRHWLPSLHILK